MLTNFILINLDLMKNILLLTDFSENSSNAIQYALNLYKRDTCSFFILHVKSSTSYTTDDLMSSGNKSIYDSIIEDEKNKLSSIITQLKKDFKTEDFQFETMVDYDVLTDSIKQVVIAKKIDLIVMGSNGVTGAKEIVFGSNTINVIRKVDCDILVIPEGFKYEEPKEMLLPLDSLDSISGTPFLKTLKFLKKSQSSIHILRINPSGIMPDEQKEDLNHIAYFLKDTPHKYRVVNNISIDNVVNSYIQTNDINLTVIIVQKESLFERFFMGSSTAKIGNYLLVPLLVFHSD